MSTQNTFKQFGLFFIAVVAIIFSGALFTGASAQAEEEVTDEELQTYAMVMDSIDAMKENIQEEYNNLIQAEELMQGGRRFVEIQGAIQDSLKLKELEVTEEEKMAYENIQAEYEVMTAEFKENYTNLIKDELGGTAYNKITKAISSDGEVKTRYEAILSKIKEEKGEDTAETEENVEG